MQTCSFSECYICYLVNLRSIDVVHFFSFHSQCSASINCSDLRLFYAVKRGCQILIEQPLSSVSWLDCLMDRSGSMHDIVFGRLYIRDWFNLYLLFQTLPRSCGIGDQCEDSCNGQNQGHDILMYDSHVVFSPYLLHPTV